MKNKFNLAALMLFLFTVNVVWSQDKQKNDEEMTEDDNDYPTDTNSGKNNGIFSGSSLTGGGGGFYFLAGFGSDPGSSFIMGARGFATISKSYRLGGYGQVAGFLSSDSGIGHGGIYMANYFHFESISIGIGSNGGYGVFASDKNLKESKQIIVVQPHLEIEWPIHDFCTFSAILGNQFVLAKFNDPGLNQLFMGLSFNFGHFARVVNTSSPNKKR